MRVSLVLAFVAMGCGSAYAQAGEPAADQTGVVVNLEALPIPLPRAKPTPEEMRPMARIRPREKPDFAALAASLPLPRPKPEFAAAELLPAAAPATQKVAHTVVPTPAIVSPQMTAESLPYTLKGPSQPATTVVSSTYPVDGFAVLSRIRFQEGRSELSAEGQAALDDLAARLQASAERVRLAAFSGEAGDASSDARRLSLARALAVRAYLESKGIASTRVDVLAFGGAAEGTTDRVIVLIRGI